MTLPEQAERMAERLEKRRALPVAIASRAGCENPPDPLCHKAAALLRQCAEALRKEGV